MKKLAVSACVAIVAIVGFSPRADAQPKGKKKATVTIVNKADWDIHHLYLSPTEETEWGPDQLGKETIGKGETFKLTDIRCDSYDVKLVDEDGDECVVEEVDICASEDVWTINNKDLLKCQGFGR